MLKIRVACRNKAIYYTKNYIHINGERHHSSHYVTHHCGIETIIEKKAAEGRPSSVSVRRMRVSLYRRAREGNFFFFLLTCRRDENAAGDQQMDDRSRGHLRLSLKFHAGSFWADPERRTTTSRHVLTCFYHLRTRMRSGRG